MKWTESWLPQNQYKRIAQARIDSYLEAADYTGEAWDTVMTSWAVWVDGVRTGWTATKAQPPAPSGWSSVEELHARKEGE